MTHLLLCHTLALILSVITMTLAFIFLKTRRTFFISSVPPEYESIITISFFMSMSISPCNPSAECKNADGMPTEDMVAEIFLPIKPDLPSPITPTRPLQFFIKETALSKFKSKCFICSLTV